MTSKAAHVPEILAMIFIASISSQPPLVNRIGDNSKHSYLPWLLQREAHPALLLSLSRRIKRTYARLLFFTQLIE